MAKYAGIQKEETLKAQVFHDFFGKAKFAYEPNIDNIDFVVTGAKLQKDETFKQHYLWAEAKKGIHDIPAMLTQLILTIKKTYDKGEILPPPYIGCFDSVKISFVPFHDILPIFNESDFNWNITPSGHEAENFVKAKEKVTKLVLKNIKTYIFSDDKDEIVAFINKNMAGGNAAAKFQINKNNFVIIYNKWLEKVKKTIAIDWSVVKKQGIIDGDFFLADLLSKENYTLKDKLFVILLNNQYKFDKQFDNAGFSLYKEVGFSDNQKAHKEFWARYERPPLEEYWDYIINRRDLLVPQDIRERKGSFFTPQQWVELSQKYIADVLGENWQDEYYIWDCAAGTGNLLAGLTNKYNLWASTLDKADVDVMHERIKNGANLLGDHVFQFDFLNDDFSKLPKGLREIIGDEKRRKKLVVYINPPYAEAPKRNFYEEGKLAVEQSKINAKYANILGQANREVFVQFLTRIYQEIPQSIIAHFSKLKILQSQHFVDFRKFFLAKLEKMFICPANTFDNVTGNFPIGFMVWSTKSKKSFEYAVSDVYDKNCNLIARKKLYAYDNSQYINDWVKPFRAKKDDKTVIGKFPFMGNDFQQQSIIQINPLNMVYNKAAGQFLINPDNLIIVSVYFTVRKIIPVNWLNDRDQFLYPNDGWKEDSEFQNDCLAYTLFSNNIQSKFEVNHWIPFSESEVNARDNYDSHFMISFLGGKLIQNGYSDLFTREKNKFHPKRKFSAQAKAVFKAEK